MEMYARLSPERVDAWKARAKLLLPTRTVRASSGWKDGLADHRTARRLSRPEEPPGHGDRGQDHRRAEVKEIAFIRPLRAAQARLPEARASSSEEDLHEPLPQRTQRHARDGDVGLEDVEIGTPGSAAQALSSQRRRNHAAACPGHLVDDILRRSLPNPGSLKTTPPEGLRMSAPPRTPNRCVSHVFRLASACL